MPYYMSNDNYAKPKQLSEIDQLKAKIERLEKERDENEYEKTRLRNIRRNLSKEIDKKVKDINIGYNRGKYIYYPHSRVNEIKQELIDFDIKNGFHGY